MSITYWLVNRWTGQYPVLTYTTWRDLNQSQPYISIRSITKLNIITEHCTTQVIAGYIFSAVTANDQRHRQTDRQTDNVQWQYSYFYSYCLLDFFSSSAASRLNSYDKLRTKNTHNNNNIIIIIRSIYTWHLKAKVTRRRCSYSRPGATEIAGVDKSARSKLQGVENAGVDNLARDDKGGQGGSGQCGTKWQGWKTREWTSRHEMTRVDKAGVETRDRLIWQKVVHSRLVHPCHLVPCCPLPRFQRPRRPIVSMQGTKWNVLVSVYIYFSLMVHFGPWCQPMEWASIAHYRCTLETLHLTGDFTNSSSSSSSSSDAKRSAEASRRCDRSPERSVLR